ncbi:dimethylamine monooxygenase subunit DmmA family protein, partial [Cupriavidus basilensis]
AGVCRLLYAAGAGADLTQAVLAAGADVTVAASTAALLDELGKALASLPMGLRFYAAGDEDFLAQASRLAERHGLDPAEMQCECVAPGLRRVYCVHCRTCNEAVAGGIAACAGCRRKLLVRDHYSRRLAAFMGVMADAETPGAA